MITRRSLLIRTIFAPAIVRVTNLMPIKSWNENIREPWPLQEPTWDMGVFDVMSNPLTRVDSLPNKGQYVFNEATGLYTFSQADAGRTFNYYQLINDNSIAGWLKIGAIKS